jgi:hypothetical protein
MLWIILAVALLTRQRLAERINCLPAALERIGPGPVGPLRPLDAA